MSQRESRKHQLVGDGSSGAPPAKRARDRRTGVKRPRTEEEDCSDMEESFSEMEMTQMQTQDEKETDLTVTLVNYTTVHELSKII